MYLEGHGWESWGEARGFVADASEQVARMLELPLEDGSAQVEEGVNLEVTGAVEDGRALFAVVEEAFAAQDGELLADGTLVGLGVVLELTDASFAYSECIEDGEAQWVSEGFEEFGLKLVQGGVHA